MSYIGRGANTLSGSTPNGRNELTGFVSLGVFLGILLGLTALPLARLLPIGQSVRSG